MTVENKAINIDEQLALKEEAKKRITVIEYDDQKTLMDTTSKAFKTFQEVMLSDKPFIFKSNNGDPIGTKTQHFDANPQIFQTLSELLNQQPSPSKRSTKRSFSPTYIQERIDVGQIMFNHPEHIEQINSLATDQLFKEAMKDTPKSENPAIAFGLINTDAICILDRESGHKKIQNAIDYAFKEGKEQGKTEAEVTQEIEHFAKDDGINMSGKIENIAQLVGYILRSFHEEGGKPQVTNKELLDKIIDIFEPSIYQLGGAASQMVNLLDGDGENVALITPYQSERQSNLYTNNPSLIKLTKDGYTISKVKDKENKENGLDIPEKTNIAIQHEDGVKISFNGTVYVANGPDRVIAKSPGYYDKNGNVIKPEPTFNCSDETLEKLAKESPLFILNNLQNVQSYPPEKYERVMTTLIRQLEIIKRCGAKIIIEISGDTSDMRYLSDLKGLIDFISLNGGELSGVNKTLSKTYPDIKANPFVKENKNYFSIYQNALSLLEVSQAEIINVHETEMDLTVMHAKSRKELNKKTMANLHSKLKVYGHLAGLTPQELTAIVNEGKLSPALMVEGKIEIINFAKTYAKSLNLITKEEADVINEILTTLSYYNPNGPSISLAPSKGLNGVEYVHSTGAGDRTLASAANEFYKDSKDDYYPSVRIDDLNLIA
jgi:ADP-dependent phosphofructokinase/glucokinase